MKNGKLLGSSRSGSTTIMPEQLGAPGVVSYLVVQNEYSDDRYKGKGRIDDTSVRDFECKARFSSNSGDTQNLNFDIKPEHGSSYLLMEEPSKDLRLQTEIGEARLRSNDRGEMAMAVSTITARSVGEARELFHKILSTYLDRTSYLSAIPIHMDLIVVKGYCERHNGS